MLKIKENMQNISYDKIEDSRIKWFINYQMN